jgi:hypothetical protein
MTVIHKSQLSHACGKLTDLFWSNPDFNFPEGQFFYMIIQRGSIAEQPGSHLSYHELAIPTQYLNYHLHHRL